MRAGMRRPNNERGRIMKKIITLIISLMLVTCLLAACGGGDPDPGTTPSGQSGEYTFTYKGTKLYIGMDAEEAVNALKDYLKGEPTVTASCAFEGNDYKYFYGSFYLCTGTLNGKDIVDAFWFVDDTITTDEGLAIGDSKEKVEQLYGSEGYNGINAYIFEGDPCWLTIILEGDMVSSIQYVYKGQLQ